MATDAKNPVFVFTHPNHELAVYGLLQRLRPWTVFMTDGGGAARVADTRAGLARIGASERARFLGHSEGSFYEGLLERDDDFFAGVAARLAAVLRELRPDAVYCDAVEFYNPVHDLGLPLVRAALAGVGAGECAVFEVPLVFQRSGGGEEYTIQRAGGASREAAIVTGLTHEELAAKLAAFAADYPQLRAQMGTLLDAVPREEAGREVVMPAREVLPTPGGDVQLRYEWRARKLLVAGEIDRMITYEGHFKPVVERLVA